MANENIYPYLKQLADEVIEVAQRNLGAYRTVKTADGKRRKRRAVATGNLKDNLNATIRTGKSTASINFGARGTAREYFRAVNDGRKKGSMPPPTKILDWMKVKPVRLRNGNKFVKQTEKGMIRAAFAIATSIKKNGIPAFPYYDEAIEQVLREKGDEFKNNLQKEIELALKSWQ